MWTVCLKSAFFILCTSQSFVYIINMFPASRCTGKKKQTYSFCLTCHNTDSLNVTMTGLWVFLSLTASASAFSLAPRLLATMASSTATQRCFSENPEVMRYRVWPGQHVDSGDDSNFSTYGTSEHIQGMLEEDRKTCYTFWTWTTFWIHIQHTKKT